MLSVYTRSMVSVVAGQLMRELPLWKAAIQEQAARGETYRDWRRSFQPLMDAGYLDMIMDRSRARGEEPEELLRCLWEALRRAAGVPVPEEKCPDE